MNIKLVHLALCSSVSFFAGLLLTTGGFRGDAAKTLGIAGLSALPVGYLSYLITDSKAANKLRKAEKEVSEYGIKLSSLERLYSDCEAKLADVNQQLEQLKINSSRLIEELAKSREMLAVSESGRNMLADSIDSLQTRESELLTKLETISGDSAAQINHLQARVTELTTEIEEYNQHFDDCVQSEADKRANELFQTAKVAELEKIYQQHDAINQRAIKALDVLKAWGFKAISLSHQKHDDAMNYARQYNSHIDEFSERVNKERAALLEQLEACNMRLALLQRELNGDLVEPQYGDFGFDVNGKIANAIAREVFTDLGIPLAVKGFHVKSDGAVDVGYGYSRSIQPQALVEALTNHSANIAKRLGIHKIVGTRKLEITDCIALTYRTEPAVRDSDINYMIGSPDEFVDYIVSNPIRYRLIADPETGKTPLTAVMVSEILKSGCRRGNTSKGEKIPNTLVTVSYPDALSSQKDTNYPLEIFLKYGDTTAAIKSFSDATDDWEYRKKNTAYADNFFQLWVWDEIDYTLDSASDPSAITEDLKLLLKKGGHNAVGYITSGQSCMTSQIRGFKTDDRSLFTEIIIGIPKVRQYLRVYGKGKQSDTNLAKLARNLDEIEEYIEHKNNLITDDARLLRVALVIDKRSPKLYFLPNFDRVQINTSLAQETRRLAESFKRSFLSSLSDSALTGNAQNPYSASTDQNSYRSSNLTMESNGQSVNSPHCPHCGSCELKLLSDDRYNCKECKKRFVESKAVWK